MAYRKELDKRYEDCAIFIAPEEIKKACMAGKLGVIDKENEYARVGGTFNIYFGIKGTKVVLMHIKKNLYVVIDKTIKCKKTGKWIFLVKRLAKGFHFNISNGEVVAYARIRHGVTQKNIKLSRVVIGLAEYGDIKGLKSFMDAHHVAKRFMNTVNCIRLVDESIHWKYHSQVGYDSRREGKIIRTEYELDQLIKEVKKMNRDSSVMKM